MKRAACMPFDGSNPLWLDDYKVSIDLMPTREGEIDKTENELLELEKKEKAIEKLFNKFAKELFLQNLKECNASERDQFYEDYKNGQKLIERLFNPEMKTTQRMELYDEMDSAKRFLHNPYIEKERQQIFALALLDAFNNRSGKEHNDLSEWVFSNSRREWSEKSKNNSFYGAITSFSNLYHSIKDIIRSVHLDEKGVLLNQNNRFQGHENWRKVQLSTLNNIITTSESHIKNSFSGLSLTQIDGAQLSNIKQLIFSYLGKDKELASIRGSSHHNLQVANFILAERINDNRITIEDLNITDVDTLISFFKHVHLNIRYLDLSKIRLKDEDIAKLVKNFPNIEHLAIDDSFPNSEITNESAKTLSKLKKITNFNYNCPKKDRKLTDFSFLASFSELSSLKLCIHCNEKNSNIDVLLKNCKKLAHLDLSSCINLYNWSSALQSLTQIKSLDISGNDLYDCSFLQSLTQLEKLNFFDTRINSL